jgi:hypothetical protein
MNTPSPSPTQRADLVTLTENDFVEIASFIGFQSGRTRESVEQHLRWFLLENPARRPQDALGFGLRVADQLVGCVLCAPQRFRAGSNNIFLMGSSSFYVDEHHRGHGGRIFLKYSRLAVQHPLFGTSANAQAAALWKASGASPIPNSDAELFGVIHWPPVAEEFVQRKYGSRFLSSLASSPLANAARVLCPLKVKEAESDQLQPLNSAEQVNDLLVKDLPAHNLSAKLTAVRDMSYIRWRYFSGQDATSSAFAFRSSKPDQDILVTVNQRTRGYRSQINTLNVLDVYPEVSLGDWLRLLGALITRHTGKVDAIVLRSQNPNQQKLFCEKGFQRRAFDAPTSWFLDRANLLPTRDWYVVPADGDGLI